MPMNRPSNRRISGPIMLRSALKVDYSREHPPKCQWLFLQPKAFPYPSAGVGDPAAGPEAPRARATLS